MRVPVGTVAHFLDELHYLGATGRGFAWSDEFGVLVLAKPTSRRLPQDGTWLELVRWCLEGIPNGGSQQWARVDRNLTDKAPWAPYANGIVLEVVSTRVGNYQHNPQWGTLLGQLWVH